MTRRRLVAIGAVLLAAAAIAAVTLSGGSAPKPGAGGPSTGSEQTAVERRNLVETDSETGTLSYAGPQTVYDRLSGTVTWLPSVGQEIEPGGTLFAVDGRPVVMLDGASPAYRELAPGIADGRDVLQLNRNLVALGFDPDPIALDDEWQAATTAGVQALQRSLGETASGTLALGEVVFLPGDQLVATVEATLGGSGGGSGSGSPSSADLATADTLRYAGYERMAPPSRSKLRRRIAQLEAEIGRLKSSREAPSSSGSPAATGSDKPSKSSNPNSGNGEGAGASPILQTTSTHLVVTVDLDASKQSEARLGERVTVQLPDGTAVGGRVSGVSAVAQSTQSGGGTTESVPVTVSLEGRHTGAGLDQASVSVEFAEAVARGVLCVPVTALLATGGAHYAVQEAAAPHRLLPVATGLFAAGYVQISGPGVRPGLRVSDSQG